VLYNRYIKKEIRDAIGGYDYILGELPENSKYTPALAFGFIAKYQFSKSSAAFIQFNYTKLIVSDAFTLVTDQYNQGFTSPYYELCEISGTEERINLDIGTNIYFPNNKNTYPYLEMGINIMDIEALGSEIRIRNLVYDISSPYNQYYHVKEGGIGLGGFIGGGIQSDFNDKYTLNLGASLYISKISLPGFDQHQANLLILARLLF